MSKLRTFTLMAAVALVACHKEEPASGITGSPKAAPPPAPPPVAAAAPALPFEGEIVVAVKPEATTKVPASLTFDVKGDKVRYVSPAANVRTIADVASQRVYAINDVRKSYETIDTKPTTPAAAEPKVSKSEFTQKVAGVPCEDWTIDEPTQKVDVCVARGIPFFDLASDPKAGKAEPAWAAALTREKAFPLIVEVHDKAGKEEYRAEATKIDARKLDDTVFQLPGGLRQGDLSKDMRTASLP